MIELDISTPRVADIKRTHVMTGDRDCSNLFLIIDPDEGEETNQINALRTALEAAAVASKVDGLSKVACSYAAAACASADRASLTHACWAGGCTASDCNEVHEADKDTNECRRVLNYGRYMESTHNELSLPMLLSLLVLLDEFGCSHTLLQFLATAAFNLLNKLPESERRSMLQMDADTFGINDTVVKKIVDRCVEPHIKDATGGQFHLPPPPAVDKSLFAWPGDDDDDDDK